MEAVCRRTREPVVGPFTHVEWRAVPFLRLSRGGLYTLGTVRPALQLKFNNNDLICLRCLFKQPGGNQQLQVNCCVCSSGVFGESMCFNRTWSVCGQVRVCRASGIYWKDLMGLRHLGVTIWALFSSISHLINQRRSLVKKKGNTEAITCAVYFSPQTAIQPTFVHL